MFGDFSKFYDNIIHEIAKRELLKLFDDDEFIDWLLTQIFDGFKIDVSYMTDEEYANCISILKGPIHQIILNGKDIPKKIQHEFLGSLLPFAGFDRNLVSPIQVVGVTDNLLIVHKSFTVIAILTVVNCVRLCYLSVRKGQCLLLCWLGRESGRTPLEFEALL